MRRGRGMRWRGGRGGWQKRTTTAFQMIMDRPTIFERQKKQAIGYDDSQREQNRRDFKSFFWRAFGDGRISMGPPSVVQGRKAHNVLKNKSKKKIGAERGPISSAFKSQMDVCLLPQTTKKKIRPVPKFQWNWFVTQPHITIITRSSSVITASTATHKTGKYASNR